MSFSGRIGNCFLCRMDEDDGSDSDSQSKPVKEKKFGNSKRNKNRYGDLVDSKLKSENEEESNPESGFKDGATSTNDLTLSRSKLRMNDNDNMTPTNSDINANERRTASRVNETVQHHALIERFEDANVIVITPPIVAPPSPRPIQPERINYCVLYRNKLREVEQNLHNEIMKAAERNGQLRASGLNRDESEYFRSQVVEASIFRHETVWNFLATAQASSFHSIQDEDDQRRIENLLELSYQQLLMLFGRWTAYFKEFSSRPVPAAKVNRSTDMDIPEKYLLNFKEAKTPTVRTQATSATNIPVANVTAIIPSNKIEILRSSPELVTMTSKMTSTTEISYSKLNAIASGHDLAAPQENLVKENGTEEALELQDENLPSIVSAQPEEQFSLLTQVEAPAFAKVSPVPLEEILVKEKSLDQSSPIIGAEVVAEFPEDELNVKAVPSKHLLDEIPIAKARTASFYLNEISIAEEQISQKMNKVKNKCKDADPEALSRAATLLSEIEKFKSICETNIMSGSPDKNTTNEELEKLWTAIVEEMEKTNQALDQLLGIKSKTAPMTEKPKMMTKPKDDDAFKTLVTPEHSTGCPDQISQPPPSTLPDGNNNEELTIPKPSVADFEDNGIQNFGTEERQKHPEPFIDILPTSTAARTTNYFIQQAFEATAKITRKIDKAKKILTKIQTIDSSDVISKAKKFISQLEDFFIISEDDIMGPTKGKSPSEDVLKAWAKVHSEVEKIHKDLDAIVGIEEGTSQFSTGPNPDEQLLSESSSQSTSVFDGKVESYLQTVGVASQVDGGKDKTEKPSEDTLSFPQTKFEPRKCSDENVAAVNPDLEERKAELLSSELANEEIRTETETPLEDPGKMNFSPEMQSNEDSSAPTPIRNGNYFFQQVLQAQEKFQKKIKETRAALKSNSDAKNADAISGIEKLLGKKLEDFNLACETNIMGGTGGKTSNDMLAKGWAELTAELDSADKELSSFFKSNRAETSVAPQSQKDKKTKKSSEDKLPSAPAKSEDKILPIEPAVVEIEKLKPGISLQDPGKKTSSSEEQLVEVFSTGTSMKIGNYFFQEVIKAQETFQKRIDDAKAGLKDNPDPENTETIAEAEKLMAKKIQRFQPEL